MGVVVVVVQRLLPVLRKSLPDPTMKANDLSQKDCRRRSSANSLAFLRMIRAVSLSNAVSCAIIIIICRYSSELGSGDSGGGGGESSPCCSVVDSTSETGGSCSVHSSKP